MILVPPRERLQRALYPLTIAPLREIVSMTSIRVTHAIIIGKKCIITINEHLVVAGGQQACTEPSGI